MSKEPVLSALLVNRSHGDKAKILPWVYSLYSKWLTLALIHGVSVEEVGQSTRCSDVWDSPPVSRQNRITPMPQRSSGSASYGLCFSRT